MTKSMKKHSASKKKQVKKLFLKCKGFRFNYTKKKRILTIVGLCNRYPHFGIRKSGMIPHIIEDYPETGYVEMTSISINIWWLIILIRKYWRIKN